MKSKKIKVPLNILLYIIFVLLWGVILFALNLMTTFDTFIRCFADGILLKVFVITSLLGVIITLLCRRKMKYSWMLPLFLIISTIITTTANYGALNLAYDYMSVYTKEKWDKYPFERSCMIDSLNEQYDFIGMTNRELTSILGESSRIISRDGRTVYQYVIGGFFIEQNAYDFIFENGVVAYTSFSQMR